MLTEKHSKQLRRRQNKCGSDLRTKNTLHTIGQLREDHRDADSQQCRYQIEGYVVPRMSSRRRYGPSAEGTVRAATSSPSGDVTNVIFWSFIKLQISKYTGPSL